MPRRPYSRPPQPPIRPRGPRELTVREPIPLSGPGLPPDGFGAEGVGGGPKGTLDEWFVYWASWKVMKTPGDPRQPPFAGGPDWAYQVPVLIRNQLIPRESGSDILDFVYYLGGAKIGVRVQSELHVFAPFGRSSQVARDIFSKSHLEGYDAILDVFSQHFIDDASGQKVCKVVRDAINLREWPSPILYGRGERVRAPGILMR